jgi:hypothetical protein
MKKVLGAKARQKFLRQLWPHISLAILMNDLRGNVARGCDTLGQAMAEIEDEDD